jgi:hypothetical protein
MRRRVSLAVIGLLAASPGSGQAQRLESWQHPTPPPTLPSSSPDAPRLTKAWAPDSSHMPQTHRLEGAIIGGAAFGFLGAVTGLGFCHFDAPCRHPAPFAVGGFVLGALAGVGLGGRIGELFPKHRAPTRPFNVGPDLPNTPGNRRPDRSG